MEKDKNEQNEQIYDILNVPIDKKGKRTLLRITIQMRPPNEDPPIEQVFRWLQSTPTQSDTLRPYYTCTLIGIRILYI